jgi:hypothetical protein
MGKFHSVKVKYTSKGIKEANIDYAIFLVKNGTKRHLIIESLQEDHRGLTANQALELLEALYAVNGGEFKIENRGGYLYVVLCLLAGIGCSAYLFHFLVYGGTLIKPVAVVIGAFGGTFGGLYLLYKTLSGKFREDEELFD